ncbi:MAG TPA: dihydroxyacetone kinase subunit DhaK [Roseiflexaceae bacterium]|nr:dihydroxyacetone kinase subunit DhaK [Roseiflexaceae bacterium]
MKKLINAPDAVVREALEGMALAHRDLLRVHLGPDFVARAEGPARGKVALVSGGGSGHEPLHAGFVGRGMLDAACPGAIFTSPTPDQILAATRAVDGGAGVLYIVKNYAGDVMNFEIAAELAQAEGIEVATVLVADDVAIAEAAGRRGVGTTVLLEKIAGAAAEGGASLAECVRVARTVAAQGRSMGVALTSCTVPERGVPTFELGPDEIELGIGIHGEPGRARARIDSAAAIVGALARGVLEDLPFRPGDEALAFVNGMGGTPLLELYVVYRELARVCADAGVSIGRSLVGSYMTSLEMAGCSVTLLRLDDELRRLWDAPVCTPALRWGM